MRRGSGVWRLQRSFLVVNRDRWVAAMLTLLIEGLILYGLAIGLGVASPIEADPAIQAFSLAEQQQPIPPPVEREESKPITSAQEDPKSRTDPQIKVARATPVVSPLAIAPIIVPVVVAPVAGDGARTTQSAGNVSGPGTAGGFGVGEPASGIGRARTTPDTGRYDRGGIRIAKQLHLLRGAVYPSDYPSGARKRGAQGMVRVMMTIGIKGRVTECGITQSSGDRELDETTCALMKQRLVYEPSRNAYGEPYPARTRAEVLWSLRGR